MNTPPDKCPKCGAKLELLLLNVTGYRCGTEAFSDGMVSESQCCLMTQRAQRAEEHAKELEFKLQRVQDFCVKRAGHRLMQIAQPFRELVNMLKQ